MPTYTTRNDIASNARDGVIALLNQRLAETIDLRLSIKHAHWNVKGPQFIALHELFDQLASELDGPTDDVAERIAQLGGTARGTAQALTEATSLPPLSTELFDGAALVEALAERYAALAKAVRRNINETDDMGDADAADILTALSRTLDKGLWFLEAHAQGKR